jgi:hypothetical protein
MGLDRSLDQEGVPDLEGPLPQKAKTGDPQEGTAPPSDRPASLDYGVTVEEQMRPEPLDARIAREQPDIGRASRIADDEPVELVVPGDEDVDDVDDEKDVIGRGVDPGTAGPSAEEAAVHVEDDTSRP